MSAVNNRMVTEWPDVSSWDPTWLEGTLFDMFPTLSEPTEDSFPATSSELEPPFWFEDMNVPVQSNNSGVDVENVHSEISHANRTNSTTGVDPLAPSDAVYDGVVDSTEVREVSSRILETPKNKSHDESTFHKSLYEFEGGPKWGSPRRKRRRFDPERRKEVSQLRKVGACIRCKLTKSPVRDAPLFISCACLN